MTVNHKDTLLALHFENQYFAFILLVEGKPSTEFSW